MASVQAKADSVRTAFTQIGTCTPATITSLNELLLPKQSIHDQSNIAAIKPVSNNTSMTNSRLGKGTKSAVPPATKLEGKRSDTELSAKERAILATEVINMTLKTLSNPAKTPPQVRREPSGTDLINGAKRKAIRRSTSFPQSPLQPRSLNRISSSPSLESRSSRSSSSASMTSSSFRATAECARVAFACMRGLQSSKTPCLLDIPQLQVEIGMSALIGKLISLGLDDLALKELRILKWRLNDTCKPSDAKISKSGDRLIASREKACAGSNQNLADLLDFEEPPDAGGHLPLIINTQVQVVRLIASCRKPSVIMAALPKLKQDHQRSPIGLLLRSAEELPSQVAKVARQLETLSQLFLSLCPNLSTTEDVSAMNSKLNVPPEGAFELQNLAFQTRLHWWKLASHQGDVENDILGPFSRCLAAFIRRSQRSSVQTYNFAVQAFEEIEGIISNLKYCPSKGARSPLSTIYKLFNSAAQEADRPDEAMSWMTRLQDNYQGASVSDVQRCAIAASLAALTLKSSIQDAQLEERLMTVIEGLDGPLKGESLELDELLQEVSKVRRAAISILYNKASGSNAKSDDSVPVGVSQICESLVLLCPRFSLRYLGKRPGPDSTAKQVIRYDQRRQSVAKSAFNAIDSVFYLIKMFQSERRLKWELMDSTLQDCLKLLESIGETQSAEMDESIAATSYFVRISHLYFTEHLNMRREAVGPKDVQHMRALRRSIECVRDRSVHEKRASLETSKLERLADLYKMMGRNDDARDTLLALRKILMEDGILSIVANLGDIKPSRAAWCESESTSMLARATSTLVKLELKSLPNILRAPLYDINWSAKQKGVVLELFLDTLLRKATESEKMLKEVFLELLKVYEPQKFPIRRLRIITRFLRLDQDQRRDLTAETKNALTMIKSEAVLENSEDSALASYLPHLQALALSILELQEQHPRFDLLRPYLITWHSILDTSSDFKSLTMRIDNICELLSHLTSIADFLHMKGFAKARLAVLTITARLNELVQPEISPDDLVLSQVYLGLQYLELGYSGKAGLSLDRAQSHASSKGVAPETLVRMQLSLAEYYSSIGNSDKCEEYLMRAQTLALQDSDLALALKTSGNLLRSTCLAGLAAYAFLISSAFELERGVPGIALGHAKRSVKLARASWVKMTANIKSSPSSSEASGVENITQDVMNLSLSTSTSPVPFANNEHLPGPSAWLIVKPLLRSLLHLSKVYAHHGMFQEAIYYAEQAQRLADLVDAGEHTSEALTVVGNHWLSAGKLDKASDALVKAKELSISFDESRQSVVLSCSLGKLHRLLDDQDAEIRAYEYARKVLATLNDHEYINGINRINDSTAILEDELSKLTLKTRKPTRMRKKEPEKKGGPKKASKMPNAPVDALPSSVDECLLLVSLRGLLLRQKADALMTWKQCEEAVAVLQEANTCLQSRTDAIDQHMGIARQLLLQSVEQMSTDPVYSVLQDSTISFPAISSSQRGGAASEKSSVLKLISPKKSQMKTSTRNRHRQKSPAPYGFFDKLRQAEEHLIEAQSVAMHISSTSVLQNLTSLYNTITILLSATGVSHGKNIAHQSFAIGYTEISRRIVLRRERQAILGDLNFSTSKDDEFHWPIMQAAQSMHSSAQPPMDVLRFQKEYVEIIPHAWTAISISLSESRQELFLTRMQAGQSPFTLRLPLGRNNSRDVDEEVFDFEQGKRELLDIIELANESSHGAKGLTGRGAKTAWWAERDGLDARLKDLLENIETVWLGGFKGIFSQHRPRPDLLARFQKSFQNILDKHLPSRQKKGKSPHTILDARVLELAIGLKDASTEDTDLDEALTDLLYFIVDILQFHGERNAYDEIDFDSIVIETHDALRSYHEATLAASTTNENKHTVLILDKALHAFPWESLPCMDGLAVSRLPSLECLRERLLDQREESSPEHTQDGHFVDRESGSYILNPAGDLTTTQSTFENDLQSLDTWDAFVKREPSEADLKSILESKDILLYFGHGSGAQYIRSKAIKQLKSCAVTMLMGCSSGALTEAGDFEPYGPPADYMLAGCPALVATLWDVTDKDIDRFAKSTFANWGLLKPKVGQKENGIKAKESKSVSGLLTSGDEMSLVQAVAEGRKACNFRYLTAAAVCVYGIPVYIK